MCERSGIGTISFGYCSVLSRRKVCLKTVPIPLAMATVESQNPTCGSSERGWSLMRTPPREAGAGRRGRAA